MTVLELIKSSYRLIGNTDPEPEQIENGIEVLNQTICMSYFGDKPVQTYTDLTDVIQYPPEYVRAFRFLLASDLDIEFGGMSAAIRADVTEIKRWLVRMRSQEPEPVRYEAGIVGTPNSYNIFEG
jgi:hypothetical protein